MGVVAKWKTSLSLTLFAVLLSYAFDSQARRTGPLRKQTINMVVLHSTGGPTCDPITGRFVWVKAGELAENMRNIESHPTLGIHYMIDRDGTLRASVPESQIAHHVFGFSERSISIELINDGDGIDPFAPAQMDSLVKLLKDIIQRRGITRAGVKRHSDLDNGYLPCNTKQRRKVDPGSAFEFQVILNRVYGNPN